MDEPTSALDVVAQRSLMTKIKDLQDQARLRRHLRHARYVAGRPVLRSCDGHVRRPGDGGRQDRDDLRPPAASVHGGLMTPSPPSAARASSSPAFPGSPPDLIRPPTRLSLPSSLPQGHLPIARSSGPRCITVEETEVRCLLLTASTTGSCPPSRLGTWSERWRRRPTRTAAAQPTDEPLLRTVGLTRHFRLGGMFSKRILHAVDDFISTS